MDLRRIHRRKNIQSTKINIINLAFKKIFNNNSTIEKNIKTLTSSEKKILEIKEIINFISTNLKRGICKYSND